MSGIVYQTLDCLHAFIKYVVPCAVALIAIYIWCGLPKFVFRKVLHLVAFTCISVMIFFSGSWLAPVCAALVLILIVYPLLSLAERGQKFSDFFVEKSPGEVKRSMVMLFAMFAALTAVSWGIFGSRAAGAAAILMWGVGDASAALIGIPFGKHKVNCRFTDGKKSYEGTLADFMAASVMGFAFLMIYGNIPFSTALPAALLGGLAGALTELFSPSEVDTVTVPIVIMTVLLILL